jgi:alkyldihydroxyacetonephosphate synthase
VAERRRSWWGWGYEDAALGDEELRAMGSLLAERMGLTGSVLPAPRVADLRIGRPRLRPPAALEQLVSDDPEDRARHAHGQSYLDVLRCLEGRLERFPDLVAHPRSESELQAVLEWCSSVGAAVIPFGGGTSVVGGVDPAVGDGFAGVVTIDLAAMGRVLEVDERSLAARIQAGALGPSLEAQLRPFGLTLRHFPQSFECSSLGGWIATRAGGHFATGPTHIDDLVEALRVVTPRGVIETRRLPASGAGPQPERLFLGSEGVLGVVTEAWVRVRRRPRWRAGGTVRFASFEVGAGAIRALVQAGIQPANCRLIDPLEAQLNGVGDGTTAVAIIAFESAEHPLDAEAVRARECLRDHGGVPEGEWRSSSEEGQGGGAALAWRRSFLRAPYLRDGLMRLGVLCDTFETAVVWDRFEALHARATQAVRDALDGFGARGATVTCRFTHVYPDGPAPYFTVIAPAAVGRAEEQWRAMKQAASNAVLAEGGTITHHHAVGRDHRPWYDRERPPLFAEALRAAKRVLDPAGVLNPGVLLDAARGELE